MNTARIGTLALLISVVPVPSHAAWPHDPNAGNVGISTVTTYQAYPAIVSDGAGGAIITWQDQRNGFNDIYAQRVSATGSPLWTADGVALCTAANEQTSPMITSDGAGGAIVTWIDFRSGNYDIYAQRINASGAPQWTPNGVGVCTIGGNQSYPAITADGTGGAIVTWQDLRSTFNYDIYAQRVNAAGVAQWSIGGVLLCTAGNDQVYPTIVPDGAGRATVAWQDYRGGSTDVYAQRVNGAGTPQWTPNGVVLSIAANDQSFPVATSDGLGGAIVTWHDYRNFPADIYAQRVNAAGSALWAANGVAVCAAANDQLYPVIASDGAGGAIAAWRDARNGSDYDVYAQRISAAGAPQWTSNGVPLGTGPGDQFYPQIVSDGAGGAIVAWYDWRNGNSDIYAQRVSATGVILWTGNGVALCTAVFNQFNPAIASDGAGGAIVTWHDLRNAVDYDIYAQRVERFGYLGSPEPSIVNVRDVPVDQGGKVSIEWTASYLDADPYNALYQYWIWRQAPRSAAQTALSSGAHMVEDGATPATSPHGLWRTTSNGAQIFYWEYVGSQYAQGFPGYSYVASTTGDSVGAGNPRTYFMIEAKTYSNSFWNSAPDSGYSVDNVPPIAPAPFTGAYSSGTSSLHWRANSESDLSNYRLYRGNTSGFTPSPVNRVASPTDTTYSDAAGSPYFYKLSAVDVHGNESGFTTLLPSGTTDAPGGLPSALALARPSPNPTLGPATLRFALPRESRVRLAVYDAAGRVVRELISAREPAGEHTFLWDLRDDRGRSVGAGVYFVWLGAAGHTLTQRIAILR
jgi:hypothetical protein